MGLMLPFMLHGRGLEGGLWFVALHVLAIGAIAGLGLLPFRNQPWAVKLRAHRPNTRHLRIMLPGLAFGMVFGLWLLPFALRSKAVTTLVRDFAAALVGLCAGAAIGCTLIMLFSPWFPLVLMMAALMPLAVWSSHKPWQGKRKSGTWTRSFKALRLYVSSPRSSDAIAALTGGFVGLGLGVPAMTYAIWGAR